MIKALIVLCILEVVNRNISSEPQGGDYDVAAVV